MFTGAMMMLCRGGDRVPVVNLGIVPLGVRSRDTAPFGLGIPPLPGALGRVRNALLTIVADRVVFASLQRFAQQLVGATTGGRLTTPFLNWPALADAVVQFTVPGFEYPRGDLPDTVRFVGPMSRTQPSGVALLDWWNDLDGSRPVVHVTQGTVANRDLGALIEPTIEVTRRLERRGHRPADRHPHAPAGARRRPDRARGPALPRAQRRDRGRDPWLDRAGRARGRPRASGGDRLR